MGEIADMMLDGTLCSCCGVYLGTDNGYPTRCPACGEDPNPPQLPKKGRSGKTSCPVCGKRRKGMAQHLWDAHGVKEATP